MGKRVIQMAKRTHQVSLKGILHDDMVVEETPKDQPSEFFKLLEILQPFIKKNISITIKEEKSVESSNDD
jgi:hypothetical protein